MAWLGSRLQCWGSSAPVPAALLYRPHSCPSHRLTTQPPLPSSPQFKPGQVNVAAIQAKVFGAALARWQMGVVKAPSNRGLKPSKFEFYDRWHYYQVQQA